MNERGAAAPATRIPPKVQSAVLKLDVPISTVSINPSPEAQVYKKTRLLMKIPRNKLPGIFVGQKI
jgi:hypothetical protein